MQNQVKTGILNIGGMAVKKTRTGSAHTIRPVDDEVDKNGYNLINSGAGKG